MIDTSGERQQSESSWKLAGEQADTELQLHVAGRHVATITRWIDDKTGELAWWGVATSEDRAIEMADTLAGACAAATSFAGVTLDPPAALLAEWGEVATYVRDASHPLAERDKPSQSEAEPPLTFETLRQANLARLPRFKNAQGQPAHRDATGRDWSLCDWMTSLTGEVGEAANLIKKVRRGDFTLDEAKPELEAEIADIAIYLDLLAAQVGVDLGAAVRAKFNAKSDQVGATVFIDGDVVVSAKPAS